MSDEEGLWIPLVSLVVAVVVAVAYAFINLNVVHLGSLDTTKVVIYTMTILGAVAGLLSVGLMGEQREAYRQAGKARATRKRLSAED